jgi:hypothetical protein
MRTAPSDRSILLIIGGGYASGLLALPWLPGPYLNPELPFIARIAIAFLIPTAAWVICSSVEGLFARSTGGVPHPESASAVRIVMWSTASFMVVLHALLLMAMLQLRFRELPSQRLAMVLFGLLLVASGNVLPRVRRNIVIGIPTRRLLADPAAWARVHRVAGYIVVALGMTLVVSAVMLTGQQIPMVLSVALAFAASVGLAAYWRATRA